MRARWLVISLVVLATAAPRVFAQSVSVQAQSLFDEGRKLLQAGKLTEACAAFESSQKLDPAITTLLNLADCREQNHQLATAWGTFVDANRMARAASNDKLARVANNHAHKLEPRLSKLTINVAPDHRIPGLEVLRDKEPVNPAGWNHALPIDGGTYTITARAPGRTPWSATTTIKVEADAQVVEIPKLTDAKPGALVAGSRPGTPGGTAPASTPPASAPPSPVAPVPKAPVPVAPAPVVPAGSAGSAPSVARAGAVTPATNPGAGGPGGASSPAPGPAHVATLSTGGQPDPAPASTPPATDDPSNAGRSLRLPLAVGAGALVLGGTALGFDLWGDHTYDQAKQEMTNQARRSDLENSANTRRYVAEAFGVAAVGCAGVAVYLYVRGRSEGRAETTAVTPVASPQFAGLALAGRW